MHRELVGEFAEGFLFFYGSYMVQNDSGRENNIGVKRPESSFISPACTTYPRRSY